MSQDNVEIIRQMTDAFSEGGFNDDGVLILLDDEVVFEEPPEQPAPRTAHGREAAAAMFAQFEEAWKEHVSETEEVLVVDEERILTLTVEHFQGRDGIELSQPCGTLYTLRNDKVVRIQSFWERATAFDAAGLERPSA